MTHTFNLDKPNRPVSAIKIIVSHDGKKYKKNTGLSISTKLWKTDAKTFEKKCQDKAVWEKLSKINARLTEVETKDVNSEDDVLRYIDYALTGDMKSIEPPKHPLRPSFWDYFKEWSERDTPTLRFRKLAYRRLSALMGTNDDWEDINGDWYFRLTQKMNLEKYSHNYKSTLVAKLKTVMNEGLNRGFHQNEAFRKFSTSYETADTIALTQEEVDTLWNAELEGRQAEARDVFMVGVYTAARFQNYSILSKDNIQDGDMRIQFKQRKTQGEVLIPASPRVLSILERHGGKLPKITEQEIGRHIKTICKDLGGSFNDIIEVTVSEGNAYKVEKKHRYEMVTTHTARRTGATLLYKSGVPIRVCRFLTGHTSDTYFMKYIKIGTREAANILAKADFFKQK